MDRSWFKLSLSTTNLVASSVIDLSKSFRVSLYALIWMQHACYLRAKCHAPGGALALRFGNSNYSGATIDHLHWQFIVPDIQASDYQKVRLSIGKDKTKLQAASQNEQT